MSIAQTVMSRPVGVVRREYPGIALAVIVTCQLMLVLDGTVVNIALPKIQGALHFSATGLSWVLNAYTLAFGGLLLLGGRAGDVLGRRRVFVAGIALFTVASLVGGFANSAAWLLITRAGQGVGAALAAPSTLALIATTFAEGPQRNRALGLFSAASGAGASVGLILGGILTAALSWRWVLFINVPIGVAVVLLAPVFIREPQRRPGALDVGGALTATAGMVALVYGFIRAASNGWSDRTTMGAFALALVLLALFLTIELNSRQPILPLHLLANRDRAGAYLNMLLLPATMFGVFFFLTQFLQKADGFGPLQAGLAFLPWTLVMFATVRTVPTLLQRFSARRIMVAGALLITGAMLWLAQISASTGYASGLLGPMLLMGIGVGCSFLPLNVTILSGVAQEESGAASGLLQTMQQVGGTVGLAVLVTIFGAVSRATAANPPAGISQQGQGHSAFAHGIASAFTAGAIVAACILLVALFAIRAKPPLKPDGDADSGDAIPIGYVEEARSALARHHRKLGPSTRPRRGGLGTRWSPVGKSPRRAARQRR